MTAFNQVKPNKAPGPDNIPFELKAGRPALHARLFMLILQIWEKKQIPQDLKDAVIVTIFKKGDRSLCGNYRGISLLSIAGKIIARILLQRFQVVAESVFPESQCGFRKSRGTIDMIFCARQIQEKSQEQQKPVFFIFCNLEKAFDSVPREVMWDILHRYSCPGGFISLIKGFHDEMLQPCFLSTSLPCSPKFQQTTPEWNSDVDLMADFSTSHVSDQNITVESSDNAAPASTAKDLQTSTNNFSRAYQTFGLKVNITKTKVLAQPAPRTNLDSPNITINNQSIEVVEDFCCLGSFLSSTAGSGKDIEHRIQSGHASFGHLKARVFCNKDLTFKTKLMVYQAVAVSTLLYGCETWTVYRKDMKKLERFHQSKLCSVLNINWEDHITNNSVLERSGLLSIEALIIEHRLR
eukprot:XP_014784297.1 PREDICTED: uncharacterized protein LOC106879306 [Octopus bimaculoides]